MLSPPDSSLRKMKAHARPPLRPPHTASENASGFRIVVMATTMIAQSYGK